jgi:HAD superfamily hydrolase (TIGR01509 family)
MPAMLTAVCFDLMDTVIYDPFREAIEAGTGLDLKTAAKHRDASCWPAFEIAEIDEETFARRYFPEGSPFRFDMEAFHRVRREGYRFLPGMRELVGALGGRVDRYVASNYPVWIEEVRHTFALDTLFEDVIASHHLRARKPAPTFFEGLLARVPHAAEACLFVDDRVDNCEGAERMGMRAHHFTSAEDLEARLRTEKLLP